MWAQQIKLRVKPGTEVQARGIVEQLRATEQPESGLLREFAMRDQRDPTSIYVLAVVESEEKARAREQDPRCREGLQKLNAMMAEVLTGPPEFVDLAVLDEIITPSSQPWRADSRAVVLMIANPGRWAHGDGRYSPFCATYCAVVAHRKDPLPPPAGWWAAIYSSR